MSALKLSGTENCIQCGGNGVYVPAGRSGYACGFCNATGQVPLNTQWLIAPYQSRRPKQRSNVIGYIVVGAFLFSFLMFVLSLAHQLEVF